MINGAGDTSVLIPDLEFNEDFCSPIHADYTYEVSEGADSFITAV